MPNTGRKIVLTLKERYVATHIATGATKPDALSDPDYIPPYISSDCAVTFTTSCPIVIATGGALQLEYEFAAPNSVINNPAIAKVKIKLMNGATVVSNLVVNLPHGNYFSGTLSGPAGTYSMDIDYLDVSNTVLATCVGVATGIVIT
jgi:hypothetical protein